ncbi:hypothetical protein DEJ45_13905 [Streptomyces venezuelae]|uniref:hypothetical protein n=1 Tax=Streptomyces venezuelae TaxID=54571 RepID=UPI00123D3AF3|nr:hypothetical protein [Streptomyces venezuelae]QES13397.1 hypothetical protein DEJ45_13905 [Streptomyces venezuelae]
MSGYGGGGRGRAHWNDETQSWESEGTTPAGGTDSVAGGAGGVDSPAGGAGGAGPLVPLPSPPPPTYAPGPPPEHTPGHVPPYGPGHAPVYVPETGGWQYGPAGGGTPEARPPRSRTAVAAGVAAAVLAAGSVGGWLLWRGDGGAEGAAGPAASVSVSDGTTPTGDPTADPTAEPTADPTSGTPSDGPSSAGPSGSAAPGGAPPAGYRVLKDLKGFTIAVPDGWHRTESDDGVFYNAPDGRSLLQVFVVTEPGLTPYEALRAASQNGRTTKPGYQELGLERITGEPGVPADTAELVYAYTRDDGSRRKVVDRAFTAEDGNHYAVLAAGPETDWPKQRTSLSVALRFFRPGAY